MIATAIYLLQLMGYMGFSVTVAIAPREHHIDIPQNSLFAIKIAAKIVSCEQPFMQFKIDIKLSIIFQSRSVDKRHAVLTYDQTQEKFRVKDLGSINGVSTKFTSQ